MNLNELATVKAFQRPDPTISVTDLTGPDRTLVYGYEVGTHITVHVYLKDGEIHRLRYNAGHPGSPIEVIDHIHGESLPAIELRPSKRAYPERTDAEFATLMIMADERLTFTKFDDERWAATTGLAFHGSIA